MRTFIVSSLSKRFTNADWLENCDKWHNNNSWSQSSEHVSQTGRCYDVASLICVICQKFNIGIRQRRGGQSYSTDCSWGDAVIYTTSFIRGNWLVLKIYWKLFKDKFETEKRQLFPDMYKIAEVTNNTKALRRVATIQSSFLAKTLAPLSPFSTVENL